MTVDVLDEPFGLGPLEALLKDPTSGHPSTQLHLASSARDASEVRRGLRDDKHLMQIIERIVSSVGAASTSRARWSTRGWPTLACQRHHPAGHRRPMPLDPPVPDRSLGGADLSIGAPDPPDAGLHGRGGRQRLNVIVCGGTGAGKTTLLNVLSGFISETSGSSPSRTRRAGAAARRRAARDARRTSRAPPSAARSR
jgi:pilus assembly protein CpaF